MRNRQIHFISILSIILLFPTATFVGSEMIQEAPLVGSATKTVNTQETWENQQVTLNELINVTTGGDLSIINSDITFTAPTYGIRVDFGGILTIIDSKIHFTGEDHAIFGLSNGDITLQNATISSDNGDGVHVEGNYNFNVDKSTFRDSGDDGFHVESNSLPVTVSNSFFIENGDDGFDFLDVSGLVTLSNSSLIRNSGHAIKLVNTGDLVINDNYFLENQGDGLKLENAGKLNITNSIIIGAGIDTDFDNRGIDVDDSTSIYLSNVTIKDYPSDGIKSTNTPTTMDNVLIENAGDESVQIEFPTAPIAVELHSIKTVYSESGGLKIEGVTGNVIMTNITIIDADGGDGIKLEEIYGEAILENILISNAGDDGLQITKGNTSAQISDIEVDGSFEDGFELDTSPNIRMENVLTQNNVESGIYAKNMGNLHLINFESRSNGDFGLDMVNGTSLTLENPKIANNLDGGIQVTTTDKFSIKNGLIEDNQDLDIASPGIFLEGVTDFEINSSQMIKNSGSGIIVSGSSGIISENKITQNQVDGITTEGITDVQILANNLSSNGRHGLMITNRTIAVVTGNTFTQNSQYGVYVEASENRTQNLDNNYWGSSSGPAWQEVGDNQQEGVYGDVNITSILDSNGNQIEFTPPRSIDFQVVFMITIIVILVGSIATALYFLFRRRKWYQTTKPLAIIHISKVGLPVHEYIFREGLVDSTLISGFLSATSSFGAELIKDKDQKTGLRKKIRELEQNENTIVIYVMKGSMISLIVDSSNPVVIRQLESFGDELINLANKYNGEDLDKKIGNIPVETFNDLVKAKFSMFTS